MVSFFNLFYRLATTESSSKPNTGPIRCAICQIDQTPDEGVTINGDSFLSHSSKKVEGAFFCADCQKKKDAMEGKRPNRQMITSWNFYNYSLPHILLNCQLCSTSSFMGVVACAFDGFMYKI